MMKKSCLGVTLGILFLLPGGMLEAKESPSPAIRVGVVDFQRAINETDAGKKAEKELNTALDERKKKFDILKNELEALRSDFEKQRLVLSGKPLEEKRDSLQKKLIEVEQTGMSYEQDLAKKKAESLRGILTGLQTVVQKIGAEESYTFIFEKSQGGVLFSSSAEDITDRVINEYNKTYKK